jgi:hypothetical protein
MGCCSFSSLLRVGVEAADTNRMELPLHVQWACRISVENKRRSVLAAEDMRVSESVSITVYNQTNNTVI